MNNWKEILKDEDKRKRYERYFAATLPSLYTKDEMDEMEMEDY